MAAPQGAVLPDALRRRPAGGQAPLRAGEPEHSGHHLSRRRDVPGRAVLDRGDRRHPLHSRAGVAGHRHPGRHCRPYRRLEDRPGARDRPDDRRGALPRPRRQGRAGAGVRLHQCASRRRFAVRAGGRPEPAQADRERRGPRRDHHLLLQCRPDPLRRRGRPRRGAAGAAARPLAEARGERRVGARLHGRRCPNSSRRRSMAISRAPIWWSSSPAARASRAPPWPSSPATR